MNLYKVIILTVLLLGLVPSSSARLNIRRQITLEKSDQDAASTTVDLVAAATERQQLLQKSLSMSTNNDMIDLIIQPYDDAASTESIEYYIDELAGFGIIIDKSDALDALKWSDNHLPNHHYHDEAAKCTSIILEVVLAEWHYAGTR